MKQNLDICKIYPSKKVNFWNSLIRLTLSQCSNNQIICAISQQELKLSNNYPILDGILLYSSIDIFPNQSIKVIHNTKEWYVIAISSSVISDPLHKIIFGRIYPITIFKRLIESSIMKKFKNSKELLQYYRDVFKSSNIIHHYLSKSKKSPEFIMNLFSYKNEKSFREITEYSQQTRNNDEFVENNESNKDVENDESNKDSINSNVDSNSFCCIS